MSVVGVPILVKQAVSTVMLPPIGCQLYPTLSPTVIYLSAPESIVSPFDQVLELCRRWDGNPTRMVFFN